eukprot:1159147-Pelagomonas_calceolata.AAC.4
MLAFMCFKVGPAQDSEVIWHGTSCMNDLCGNLVVGCKDIVLAASLPEPGIWLEQLTKKVSCL